MRTIYKCWLPNASAYISLKHLGGVGHSRNLYEELRLTDPALPNWRSFLQHRPLTERPGIRQNRHSKAEYVFLFQAVIKEDSSTGLSKDLSGIVYVVPLNYATHLQELHALKAKKDVSDESNFLLQEIAASGGPSAALMAMRFTLEADGYLQIQSLHSTTDFEEPKDPNLSYGQHNAFEIYSFLRDAFHKHKFHSARDDYSLEPYVVTSNIDQEWIGKVARSLHRSVISGYRGDNERVCSQSLGKLAYLEAFYASTRQRGLEMHLPKLNLESLKAAIQAMAFEMNAAIHKSEQKTHLFLAFLAVFIPFIFVVMQLLQVPCIDGLNYDYKAAETLKDGTIQTAIGNCSNARFGVSSVFLNFVDFVLPNLHWVTLAGMISAILFVGIIYKPSWLSGFKFWLITKSPSLYRYAIAEPHKVMVMLAQIMLAVFVLAFTSIAEIYSVSPIWWAYERYLWVGIGLIFGAAGFRTLHSIYKKAP